MQQNGDLLLISECD